MRLITSELKTPLHRVKKPVFRLYDGKQITYSGEPIDFFVRPCEGGEEMYMELAVEEGVIFFDKIKLYSKNKLVYKKKFYTKRFRINVEDIFKLIITTTVWSY